MGTYLITGGCGFIGTQLANKLKNLNHTVTIIDLKDKITKYHKDNFETIDIDIRDFDNFNKLNMKSFDCIFHLAAQTSGRISEEEPELDIDTNIKGLLNLLRWMKFSNNKRIIFTSSMAVYGDSDEAILENKVLSPLSNYGVSKITSEYYLKMYEQYGIKNTIFRLFNVYGCGQDLKNLKQGMASIYIAQAIHSNTINVTGSIERFRDFVHVDDVVNALILPLNDYNMWGKKFNVGTGIKSTVKELIDLIQRIKGESININMIGDHNGDQFGTFANCSSLLKFGWKPKIKLENGIKEMYDWAVKNG